MNEKSEPMDSLKNIVAGQARIIWAVKSDNPLAGDQREPAWVIPGGYRTTDKNVAMAYAVRANRMLSRTR